MFASIGIVNLLIYKYTGGFLPSYQYLFLVLSYFVEAMAFAGLIYLISQYAKSPGVILGSGIALFFILLQGIWDIIIILSLTSLKVDIAVKSGAILMSVLEMISPSNYPTMVVNFINGTLPSGISAIDIVLIGVIWAAVPAILSFFLAISRD